MNKNEFNGIELYLHGFSFCTKEEENLLVDILREELMVRVGEGISRCVGDKEMKTFYILENDDDIEEWIKKKCPEYRQIVVEETEKMKCEIMRCRERITGVVFDAPANVRNKSIDDLDFSNRSYNCLNRAGLKTIGDILDYGDLRIIRNLDPTGEREILLKIWEVIGYVKSWDEPDLYDLFDYDPKQPDLKLRDLDFYISEE